MKISSAVKVSAILALSLAVTGCATERLNSLKRSISSIQSDKAEAKQWFQNHDACQDRNTRAFKEKYPAKTFPDFQVFTKTPDQYGVAEFASKQRLSSDLEAKAVLDMSNGVSECVKQLLASAHTSNKYMTGLSEKIGPLQTQYQINVADYLNGSQTRGDYARRAVKLMEEYQRGGRVVLQSLNREMNRLKIAAVKEKRRSKQRWVTALQALDQYNRQQYNDYIKRFNAMSDGSSANRFNPNQCNAGGRPVYKWGGNGYSTECQM